MRNKLTKRLQLAGQKFGRLTVVKYVGVEERSEKTLWLCSCECGRSTVVRSDALTTGNTKTCGCSATETGKKANAFKHGHAYGRQKKTSPEYNSWNAMRARCSDPENNRYSTYGALGIRVCERWDKSFQLFLADVGPRPTPKHSLGRFLDSGNYEPQNARWMSRIEQGAERRGKIAMLAFRKIYGGGISLFSRARTIFGSKSQTKRKVA